MCHTSLLNLGTFLLLHFRVTRLLLQRLAQNLDIVTMDGKSSKILRNNSTCYKMYLLMKHAIIIVLYSATGKCSIDTKVAAIML
jgi:hypothetical protein